MKKHIENQEEKEESSPEADQEENYED